MRHNFLLLVPILLSLFSSACRHESATEPQSPLTQNTDTLIRTIMPGVTARLESMKDSYTFDDSIYCHLVLHNDTSSTPFIIDGSYPAYLFRVVSQETGEIVAFAPGISFDTEEHDTLRAGDSLSYDIIWTQNIYSPTNGSSGLKTFSGKYLCQARIIGNSLLLPMFKQFEVTDVGNPLSANLTMDYVTSDSIKAAMTVRNRRSEELKCVTENSTPIQAIFLGISNSDTALIERYALQANEITFAPHSDSLLFSYEAARTDNRFNHFKGGYRIIITLFFQSGKVSCWAPVSF